METINFDEFKKVELRIGKIKKAERVEGTDRLLKLEVDLKDEVRTIVAGLAKSYEPDNLLELSVAVVTNLEPREIKGIESKGMILAADGDVPVVLCPEKEVPEGSYIK